MSDLVPSIVPLSAGLSLQVPKLMAPPGSLTSVLNYEQVDMQGQKRVDGYARYDGSLLSALDDFRVVYDEDITPAYTTEGVILLTGGDPVAIIVGYGDGSVHMVPINDNLMPANTRGREVVSDPEEHYLLLLEYMETLRQRTEDLPGPVAGLHWFRDRLYAVATTVTVFALLDERVYPNDIITTGGHSAKVLDVIEEVDYSVLSLSAMDPELWDVEASLSRNGVTIGQLAPYTAIRGIPEVASIYESRTERQVYQENTDRDFGWRFVDLGWSLNFREGLTLYGGLPSLNQNLGAIGSGWSGTGGNTGSPLILTQNINISNDREQVNGWKNSNTPTSYGLSPSNITTLDSAFIYADAYVSWDGETRVITVAKDNLVEYPATATVEVSPE